MEIFLKFATAIQCMVHFCYFKKASNFIPLAGLLVKEMLALASESPEYKGIARNTSGVVFYAVPHRGADLGDFTTSFKLLLLPSVEVQELEKGGNMLHIKFY